MHGWIVIDKPVGPGSTQIVSAVKRALRTGGYPKLKVGHGGTLDPLASGVLPVAVGEATKLAGRMLDSDKVYDFTIGFGVETDTLDGEGKAVATSEVRPTLAEIEAVLPRFTGPISQVPPAFSALKVDGERAYDLARKGEAVEIAERQVTIHSLQILPELARGGGPLAKRVVEGQSRRDAMPLHHSAALNGPPPHAAHREDLVEAITLTAHVSKGTYIRSLARDIARALGTVGHVTMLRRVKAGPFTLEPAISLDILEERAKARSLEEILLPLTAGLDDIPALSVTPGQARALREGRKLIGIAATAGLYIAMQDAVPVALVESEGPEIRVVRGFNL
jgi:tRNA pseudouridine55 synthase